MKRLTSNELGALSEALDKLEKQLLSDWFLDKYTGGYVIAEMYDYDDEIIDISVQSGVEGGDSASTTLTMDRGTFEIIK